MAEKVLVTGGVGFLGSHLVDALILTGHEVAILDNFSTGHVGNLRSAWRSGVDRARTLIRVGSVAWLPDVEAVMVDFKPDVVYHLAAQVDVGESVRGPRRDLEVNVVGTFNMLDAARRHAARRFVFVSSAAIFGDNRIPPDMTPHGAWEVATDPISPYGASKAAAEVYVDLYGTLCADEAMSTTTVVLSNLYGPRQRQGRGFVNIAVRNLLTGKPVTVYGGGKNIRDYLWVGDAVHALMAAGGPHGASGRFLVGTGVGTSDEDLLHLVAEEVERQIGETPWWGKVGAPAPVIDAPARPGDIRSSFFPPSPYAGAPNTPLADGIRMTVEATRKELGL
jgi:UDP-glucose 4-epimerase